MPQQTVFRCCQMDLPACLGNEIRFQVEFDVAKLNDPTLINAGLVDTVKTDRLQGSNSPATKRFCQVVISTSVKGADFVSFIRVRRK